MRTILSKLRSLGRRGAMKAEIDEELRFHLEQRTVENVRAGMSPEDAARAARRRFGNFQAIREECRELSSASFAESVLHDVRFGLRLLRKDRGFAFVAVFTLALGMGASTAIFSMFDAVLLRALPYPESDRLVAIWERNPAGGRNVVSAGNFLDWQEQNSAFEVLGAFGMTGAALRDGGPPQIAAGASITPGMLTLLRVQPLLGRGFIERENAEAAGREILISYALWQSRFSGRQDIVGAQIHLDDVPMTIVGVMPAGFEFPSRGNDFWLALRFDGSDRESRRLHQWRVLGRLKPGVSLSSARSEMKVTKHRIAAAHPEFMTGWDIEVASYRSDLVANVRPTLLLLGGMVGLVLLVACANVANLMVARAAARQRELAIRGALGAGRGRIVRQLLVEVGLLAALGALAGLLLAQWTLPFLARLAPAQLPGFVTPGVNMSVLAFATVTLLIATVIMGLAPTGWLCRANFSPLLHGGRAEAGSVVLQYARNVLLVMQLTLATVLLAGAGLLVRSMVNLHQVDVGFDPQNLLAATVNLPRTRYDTIAKQAGFYERLRERLEAIPGVKSVAGISDPPLASTSTFSFVIAGRPRPGPNPREDPLEVRAITTTYLSTVKLRLLEGRSFVASDSAEGAAVVIVNRAFVSRYFPDVSAVGQRLSRVGHGGPWAEIVGVIGDVQDSGPDQAAAPAIYVPYAQKEMNLSALCVVVRTTGNPAPILAEVRKAFQAIDPELPLRRLGFVDQIYAGQLGQRSFVTRLTFGFAAVTLVLGVVGVYGVASYSVAQRRREFGICLALGATRQAVVSRVMRPGVKLIALGVLLGAGGAIGLARFLGNLLFEVKPADPLTFAVVIGLLGIVSLAALWLPARDAANVDPIEALRVE